jgi:hypothetical protein
MSNHTPGPLKVEIENCWPFRIQTFDAAGNVVFSRDLPSNSTAHQNAQEAMAGFGLPPEWEAAKHNLRAFADEVLRASAPDLLAALETVRDYVVTMKGMGHEYQLIIDSAIAKATGAQP